MSLLTDALNAVTRSGYIEDVKDTVFQRVMLLYLLNRYGKVDRKGGVTVRQPVLYSRLNRGSYRGSQTFNTDVVPTKDYAEVQWKQVYVNCTLTGFDIQRNQGPDGVVNLVETATEELKMNMTEELENQCFGDGTGNGALDFDGIAAIVGTTSTYGGHAYTDFGTFPDGRRAGQYKWASQNVNAQPMSLDNWELLYGRCNFGGGPKVAVMEQRPFDILWSSFVNAQRLVDSEMGKLGFNNIVINGVVNFVSDYCPTGTGYILNFELLKLFLDPARDMFQTPWKEPVNGDYVASQNLTYGNLICGNRASQGSWTGITGL